MKILSAFLLAMFVYLLVFVVKVQAQATSSASPSPSPTTLPATGIETPIFIIGGIGGALLASGLLFKKLQAAQTS